MKISMVISTFNRGHLLKQSLGRLGELTAPDELIVVDDGGEDSTSEVVSEFAERASFSVVYLYNHNPGPAICSMARNIGVRHARHDWIVTSEPELVYRTDVLAQFKELHEEHPSEIISAGTVYFAPEGFGFVKGGGWETAGDYTPPSGCQEAIGWVAPYTALWNKQWLVELGGWDEGFPGPWGWDDIDLLTRLRINGHNQHIALGVEAVHLFHGHGADENQVNEEYFRAKSFCHGDESRTEDLIANQGREWGQLTTRSS